MGAVKNVLNSLKTAGEWISQHPDIMIEASNKVKALKSEDKVNQLGTTVLELDKKFEIEIAFIHKQLRTMKIILWVMGTLLVVTIIMIVYLLYNKYIFFI